MRRLLPIFALLIVVAACGDDSLDTSTSVPTSIDAAALEEEIAVLVEAAEQIRGLEFVVSPTITIVTPEELAERVRDQIEEDLTPEDVAVAQRLYEVLGLLDGTVDLGQAYTDLYAEQVGGYYDSDTGEMVIMGGSSLSPLSESIVVHELVHALTDQHYGFAAVSDEYWESDQFERAVAISALAEGDATYFQLVYLETLPVAEQLEAVEESLATDTTVMDSLPAWFGEDLTFPYDSGFGFVERLITEGDVAGVNQAYELLPETTEQVLHPEKYLIREPAVEVVLPEVEITGYEVFEEGTFGEWNTFLYLLNGVPRGEAVVASAGWGGDRYRIYWPGSLDCEGDGACGTSIAFAYLFRGDTPRDAEELATSLKESIAARMDVGSPRSTDEGVTTFSGGARFAYVRLQGSEVLFVAAEDTATGQNLVAGLGG